MKKFLAGGRQCGKTLKTVRTKEIILAAKALAALSDSLLFEYFWQHALYYRDLPGGPQYGIRVAGVTLFDKNTDGLWKEFKSRARAVKAKT